MATAALSHYFITVLTSPTRMLAFLFLVLLPVVFLFVLAARSRYRPDISLVPLAVAVVVSRCRTVTASDLRALTLSPVRA